MMISHLPCRGNFETFPLGLSMPVRCQIAILPFSADIAANMKTVSKPTAQKILVALAEKREITQKTIGKQTYFVANQVSKFRPVDNAYHATMRPIRSQAKPPYCILRTF